ncbi:hypothetical protein OCA01_21430 [Bacillus cereus]|nr:hypothetical protein [Bacillus cereus]MCU5651926.1 hypothetical protein [Bacillus cereus]
MKGIVIAGGGGLIDIIDKICTALIDVTWFDELNDLVSDCKAYKEEHNYRYRITLPFVPIKIMKSQVLNRKPRFIRARTTC